MPSYATLVFTSEFMDDLVTTKFSETDQQRIVRALKLLDMNEQHPSLRVHQLKGNLDHVWSVSASTVLRITFERLDGGKKRLLRCTRHYK